MAPITAEPTPQPTPALEPEPEPAPTALAEPAALAERAEGEHRSAPSALRERSARSGPAPAALSQPSWTGTPLVAPAVLAAPTPAPVSNVAAPDPKKRGCVIAAVIVAVVVVGTVIAAIAGYFYFTS